MALRIIGVSGSQSGKSFDLAQEVSVGREATCSISLTNDSAVSRRHARFVWLQGLPMIEDLGSRNGTFLNGARITQARPVSSGDEVRIGSEIFRVEAVLDSTPGQTPMPSNGPKEVSRREGKNSRRQEQSGAEGSLYGKSGVGDWNPMQGCALPKIDLSGCLKYLWIFLLILIVVIVIGLIISGIATLLASAGGAASQAVSGTGSGTGTGAQRPAPTPPPPASQDQPPPQNQDQPQQAPSVEGIQIEEVKLDFAKRDGQALKPIVLVKWLNLTKAQVKKLSGTVHIFDRDGKLLAEIPRETIYSGPPVGPGEGHQDTLQQGGIVIQQKLTAPPTSAKVKVERVE